MALLMYAVALGMALAGTLSGDVLTILIAATIVVLTAIADK